MTFVVYRPGKKGLWLDLSVIIVLQLGFLAYGVIMLAQARPVFLVAAVDRIELVRAGELTTDDLRMGAHPEFRSTPWSGPRLVGVRMPTDPDEKYDLIMSGLSGKDVQFFPKYYAEYADSASSLLRRSLPLSTLSSRSEADRLAIDTALKDLGRTYADTRFVPINGVSGAATMLIDSTNGAIVTPLAVYPWTDLKLTR